MASSGRLFGTDGIRGKANEYPMSPDLVLRLGQAIGLHFRKQHSHPRILIGKDTRRSGYMLEQALASGICSVGVNVGFLGPLPTPGISYLTRGMRASAGIVISASHNPYFDNGIKIFSADGYKLPDEVEDTLEALLDSDAISSQLPTGTDIGTARRIDDAIGQYAVFLKEQFPKHLTLEGLRIVLDTANGAAYRVAPKVFEELGAELFLIGADPNGQNINDKCGALHPQGLREKVLLYKADLGIAVDGDADRLVIVDGRGETVDGDHILAICGRHLMKEGRLKNKALVTTIMSNMGLDLALREVGGSVVRTKVGDRYVVETMRKGGFNLGGEQSGHLVFLDASTTGDGILAALSLLEIVVGEGRSVHDLKQCLKLMPQVLHNVKVREKVPLDRLPKLEEHIRTVEQNLNGRGRVLFRYSGTESLARIMVEGPDQNEIDKIALSLAATTSEEITRFVEGQAS